MQEMIFNDTKLVAVERASGELRRGRVVLLETNEGALLIQALELTTTTTLHHMEQLIGCEAYIALSPERAASLNIADQGREASLIKLSRHLRGDALHSLADPHDDLAHPLMGPFYPAHVQLVKGHKAALKLCKISRLLPAALVCDIVEAEQISQLKQEYNILSVSEDVVLSYDHHDANSLELIVQAKVPLAGAEETMMVAFRPISGGTEHFALVVGDPKRSEAVLTRIHSECFTGDLLGSLKCDCGEQLRGAIQYMHEQGGGVILYLAQEGRGIGLLNKMRAYALQDQGFDTVDANERLGFEDDERLFDPAAQMIQLMGFKSVRLLTNNPRKVAGLEACGVTVAERVKHAFPPNMHNVNYLKVKRDRSGHML